MSIAKERRMSGWSGRSGCAYGSGRGFCRPESVVYGSLGLSRGECPCVQRGSPGSWQLGFAQGHVWQIGHVSHFGQ